MVYTWEVGGSEGRRDSLCYLGNQGLCEIWRKREREAGLCCRNSCSDLSCKCRFLFVSVICIPWYESFISYLFEISRTWD